MTKKNISDKDQYTKEDLDCALECLTEAIGIMNNKGLMKLLKGHAEKRGAQLDALMQFSSGKDEIKSIDDLRKKKYAMFKD